MMIPHHHANELAKLIEHYIRLKSSHPDIAEFLKTEIRSFIELKILYLTHLLKLFS